MGGSLDQTNPSRGGHSGRHHGILVTFEGPEGGGKTTQARLLAERLHLAGLDPLLTREPGGTALGDRIRDLVLLESDLQITQRAETLLYCVARAQLVEQVLRPSLQSGRTVIVDRYADSTLAYQAYGRGLDPAAVCGVLDFATAGLRPDLTFLLDVPAEAGLRRKQSQVGQGADDWNRFESEALAFHERVRDGYLALAAAEPHRWHVLNAERPAAELADQVLSLVLEHTVLAQPS